MDSKKTILAALAGIALAAALTGIRWGLPDSGKAAKLFAPQWKSGVFFDALSSGWQDIYDKARGSTPLLAETDGKYSAHLDKAVRVDFTGALPPKELHNSYRSMLIRSQYADESLPLSDLAQMKPERLDFKPPSFLYGGGYLYPLGAYYLALSKLGLIQRLPLRRLLENPDAMNGIYAAGRCLSALAFAGLCCLCFLIAGRLATTRAGTFAFIFALTAPLPLVHAHFMTPHLWAAFWGLLSVYTLLRGMPAPGLRTMLLSGICLGISAGSYWSQLHVLIFLAAVALSAGGAFFRREFLFRICALAGAGALTFLLLNPYLLISGKTALREIIMGTPPREYSYWANLRSLLTNTLPGTLGLPCTLAVAGGYVAGLLSPKPVARMLTAACVIMFFLSATTIPADFSAGVRRFFPWLLLSLVPAGLFVDSLFSRTPRLLRLPLLLIVFLPGALLAAAYEVNFNLAASPASAFSRMGAMLDAMKPEGRLGLLEFPQPSCAPHFRLDRWPLLLATPEEMPKLAAKDLPLYLLVTFHQKYGVGKLLEERYALVRGFYPARVAGAGVDLAVGNINAQLELYRLKPL
ncbi:MAG TPA: hypothetical protein PKI19_05270 [Elusimicrobiales bacterium]|nr:hypothetical protein [Elusimicrobiales bacterium]